MKSTAALILAAITAAPALADPVLHVTLEVALSPDGRTVASVEGDSSPAGGAPVVRELVLRQADGKGLAKVELPCGRQPQCWPASLAWSPDGAGLAFALRKPGSHARTLYSVGADGKKLKELLAFDGTVASLRYGAKGELAMLATAGATKELGAVEAGAAVTGDLASDVPEQRIAILGKDGLRWMSPANLFVYEYDWLPDGSGFVGTAAPGDGDNNWWVAKLYGFTGPKEAKVIFAPKDARHQIAAPTALADGRHVAIITGIMSDFGSTGGDVVSVDAKSGQAVELTPDMPASATALGLRCDGHLVARTLKSDKIQFVDLGSGKAKAEPAPLWSGDDNIELAAHGYHESCPSGASVVITENFTKAPEIAVGAIGKWTPLTSTNADLSAPVSAKSIAWESDGRQVQGWLLLPANAGSGKLPMITLVHGGPAAAVTPHFVSPSLNRALLEHGYAIFMPNPRGSYGQGEAFTAANIKDFGHGDLQDILAGIDAVEKQAPIDDSRLGILGHSYGGFMTMWTVTQTNRFKAAVAGAGIANWQSYYGQNGIDQWMVPYFGASVYDDPSAYARSSPITHIKNVKTPTLTYVGEKDVECPAAQTLEFGHALKALGVPSSMVIYPGEGHAIRNPANLADRVTRTLGWFDKYLKS
jgi:dipeptidyl aminopeptidase/acylaminoacyl peptidase